MTINGCKQYSAKDVAPEQKGAAESRANFYTDLASKTENIHVYSNTKKIIYSE